MGWIRDFFTVYKTTRVVQIRSTFLAITYLILVILVWSAFLRSYQSDLRRIYQKTCPVRGTFTSKLKGVLSTEQFSAAELAVPNPELYRRVWDTQDTITLGMSQFTVTTNLVITPLQKRGNCTMVKRKTKKCQSDLDCRGRHHNRDVTGLYTERCGSDNLCELSAWCPLEYDQLPLNGTEALLKDTKNFTVLIKNSIEFPNCECEMQEEGCDNGLYKRRNLLSNFTAEYLTGCRYDPVLNPFCPIFILGDIVKWSGADYDEVAIFGAIFRIRVTWNCDFDFGLTIHDCLPKYSFGRVDAADAMISPGYNFRTAVFHKGNSRTLYKRYGIKFLLEVAGEGKKFDFVLLVLAIGASIGLFSLAPLICDFLFDLFCFFHKAGCKKCFGKFTEEIRYQGVDAAEVLANKEKDKECNSFRKPGEDDYRRDPERVYSTRMIYDTQL